MGSAAPDFLTSSVGFDLMWKRDAGLVDYLSEGSSSACDRALKLAEDMALNGQLRFFGTQPWSCHAD